MTYTTRSAPTLSIASATSAAGLALAACHFVRIED